jgi:hypothetical protein
VTDAEFLAGLGELSATRLARAFGWILQGERMLRQRRIPSLAELAGEGRWAIVKERYPRCVQAARSILADVTAPRPR